jgi:hypothetical protein
MIAWSNFAEIQGILLPGQAFRLYFYSVKFLMKRGIPHPGYNELPAGGLV